VARSGGRARPVPVRIREIVSTRDPQFIPAHRLLKRIFHAAEMMPRADWADVLRERQLGLWTDTAWHLLVAERGGRAVAVASGMYLGNLNIGVVGYVATIPAARALGLGPRLRRRLRDYLERDARRVLGRSLEAIVGEVRVDNPWLRTLVRRYQAIALDFPYHQPAMGAGGEKVPLVLYYEPLVRVRKSLGAAELRRLLYGLYRRAYRIPRPLARPVFRHMLKSIEGRRRIGQMQLPD